MSMEWRWGKPWDRFKKKKLGLSTRLKDDGIAFVHHAMDSITNIHNGQS